MSTQLGIQTKLKVSYEEAIQKVTAALKTEGFGILTEINVKATMKEKINADFQRYVILGACNPHLAHRALSANLDVGLLLPCNVIVYEEVDHVVVAAIDPQLMLSLLKDDHTLSDIADEAKAKLQRVIESLKS